MAEKVSVLEEKRQFAFEWTKPDPKPMHFLELATSNNLLHLIHLTTKGIAVEHITLHIKRSTPWLAWLILA